MLLTEQQAREKWCPMSRVVALVQSDAEGSGSWNRSPSGDVAIGSMCIASACMMWRWIPTFKETGPLTQGGIPLKADLPMRGYCGLADQPYSREP